MKLKSYLKRNANLVDKFDELYIHTNKLHYNGTEKTEEDLHRIFLDKNIHRMAMCCWDLKLSKEELASEIVGVPLGCISSLPFHHGEKVLNIIIKKEE